MNADTLQGFLARARTANDPPQKHLYIVDESSLASTKQIRDFLQRIAPDDKVHSVAEYLFEHRVRPHTPEIVLHMIGE